MFPTTFYTHTDTTYIPKSPKSPQTPNNKTAKRASGLTDIIHAIEYKGRRNSSTSSIEATSRQSEGRLFGAFGRRWNRREDSERRYRNEAELGETGKNMNKVFDMIAEMPDDVEQSVPTGRVISMSDLFAGEEDEGSASATDPGVAEGKGRIGVTESVADEGERQISISRAVSGSSQATKGLRSKFREHVINPSKAGTDDQSRIQEELERSLAAMQFSLPKSPEKKQQRGDNRKLLKSPRKKPQRRFSVRNHERTAAGEPTKALSELLLGSGSPSRKKEQPQCGLSAGNSLAPRKLRLPSSLKLKDTLSRVDRKSVRIDGTRFVLIDPPMKTLPPLPVPPRSTSKDFSLPHYKEENRDDRPTLQTLPQEVRKKIFRFALVSRHEIMICTQQHCSCTNLPEQPALTRLNRQLRREALPIFYGENKFMIRGIYGWHMKAPAWLRVLPQPSRDMIKHIEICTHDITSAVCMMATLGFQLEYRLPRKERLALMYAVEQQEIWMTFTAIAVMREDQSSPQEDAEVPAICVWDDGDNLAAQRMDGADDSCSISSVDTVDTAILDLDARDEVIEQGQVAWMARGRLVDISKQRIAVEDADLDEFEQGQVARRAEGRIVDVGKPVRRGGIGEAELDSIEHLLPGRQNRYQGQSAEVRMKGRFSVGRDVVRASSECRDY